MLARTCTWEKDQSFSQMFEAVGTPQRLEYIIDEKELQAGEKSCCRPLWFLFRHVYRQFYELSLWSPGAGITRQ